MAVAATPSNPVKGDMWDETGNSRNIDKRERDTISLEHNLLDYLLTEQVV